MRAVGRSTDNRGTGAVEPCARIARRKPVRRKLPCHERLLTARPTGRTVSVDEREIVGRKRTRSTCRRMILHRHSRSVGALSCGRGHWHRDGDAACKVVRGRRAGIEACHAGERQAHVVSDRLHDASVQRVSARAGSDRDQSRRVHVRRLGHDPPRGGRQE